MALNDWSLAYDRIENKWVWVDTRVTVEQPPVNRGRIGRANKNGFYPYEFDFLRFMKSDITQCSFCGIFRKSRRMTRDHVWPKSKGGTHTTPACRTCNQRKEDMRPIEFAIWYSKEGYALPTIPRGYAPEDE